MKKQNSTLSNNSDGQGRDRGNRNRRNTQGKGANDGGAQNKGGNQRDQNKPEPIRLTDDQLKTKMQVMFKKWINERSSTEEEKKDENPFLVVKELLVAGLLERDEKKDIKVRADDVF